MGNKLCQIPLRNVGPPQPRREGSIKKIRAKLPPYGGGSGWSVRRRNLPINSSLLLIALLSACQNPFSPKEPSLFQQLDSVSTSVTFVNRLVGTKQMNILDYLYFYNGGGVAAGDVNGDGRADLYFVANQGPNKLYLNQSTAKTGLHFADVTNRAGVAGQADWQTGVTMADVNGDGRLDIYVCAVSQFRGLTGHNELYINQGNDATGIPTFREQAADYGLAFRGFSTQAAFFDYDHDGDLDCFLLNHAVHTSRSFDPVSARTNRDSLAGDYLFENKLSELENERMSEYQPSQKSKTKHALSHSVTQSKFKDVSQRAGIFQATMGYGLGVAVADLNGDGWEDMYVSNDFHEDDYYYLNDQHGGFQEVGRTAFGHTSRFSMGSDVADVNNDGWLDLMTTDMYPADETVEKSSQGEDPFDIFQYKLAYGYGNQYSRNCLQINESGRSFSDIGALAGVAATDWSWSPLLADYDLDGQKDLFVANGIVRRPNNLDYVKYLSDTERQDGQDLNQTLTGDAATIQKMPDGQVHSYLFRGLGDGRFDDKSLTWGFQKPGISNGAAYADLDNDGDLDLITNNINEPAGIFQNQANVLFPANRFLKIRLDGAGRNRFGVGAKVVLRRTDSLQIQQLMPTRGFESASEPVLTVGLGHWPVVDSVTVIWPDQRIETRVNVRPNQTLTFRQQDAIVPAHSFTFTRSTTAVLLTERQDSTRIPFRHRENTRYIDFTREPLMPFKLSTEGPHLAIGDVNSDGRADVFAGGARDQPGTLLLQQPDGSLKPDYQPVIAADSVSEDVDAVFFDADNDHDLDLYVVSGGNEFSGRDEPLRDRLYLNDGKGKFSKSAGLPALMGNKSCVCPADVDHDGDLDLFVGGRVVANQYGQIPDSYLLINNRSVGAGIGSFSIQTDRLAPGLRQAGMLTDAAWLDYDRDGDPDLLVVGDWMRPRLFRNDRGHLAEDKTAFGNAPLSGFWQCLSVADLDGDGDLDVLAGNLSQNTKFCRQPDDVLKLWCGDLDKNGRADQLLAKQRGSEFFPIAFRDELGKQLPGIINRRFTDYKSIAGKPITDIFKSDELATAETRDVNQFASIYFENQHGTFVMHPLPMLAQTSKLFTFCPIDLDGDGDLDVLGGGNFYGASSYQGRYDANDGLVLLNIGKGHSGAEQFRAVSAVEAGFRLTGEVRDIKLLPTKAGPLVLVARNNARIQAFQLALPDPKSN